MNETTPAGVGDPPSGHRIVVIPARGGSRRVPRKNVRPFAGRPMITWPIRAALGAGVFSHVIVSTDDSEIADVAEAAGAEVPFIRPAELSDDHTGTRPVMAHAVHWVMEHIGPVSTAVCLYATAAAVRPEDLVGATELLETSDETKFVMSVVRFSPPIWRAFRLDHSGRLERIFPQYAAARTQDIETTYHDAGQFYVARSSEWFETDIRSLRGAKPYVLPRHGAVDIDDEQDWIAAERLHSRNLLK